MRSTLSGWEVKLTQWLKSFLDRLGHKARRRMCPLYVTGLIGSGDRKSVQPMAARLAPGDYDQLHHFVAAGVWDAAPLENELLVQADKLVGGSDADGPPPRIRDKGQQHLPGDEAWLIGEHRASGEKKYHLANLPAATDLRTLAATIKARRIWEQADQQLKEELGLDHFEGRSWQGPSPPCTHDDARLRLSATQSPQKSEMGKKESTDRRLNQACRPSVTPSSRSSLECRRTAGEGSGRPHAVCAPLH
jgi:SRSO17 transposase